MFWEETGQILAATLIFVVIWIACFSLSDEESTDSVMGAALVVGPLGGILGVVIFWWLVLS